jgi:hypothetical protein
MIWWTNSAAAPRWHIPLARTAQVPGNPQFHLPAAGAAPLKGDGGIEYMPTGDAAATALGDHRKRPTAPFASETREHHLVAEPPGVPDKGLYGRCQVERQFDDVDVTAVATRRRLLHAAALAGVAPHRRRSCGVREREGFVHWWTWGTSLRPIIHLSPAPPFRRECTGSSLAGTLLPGLPVGRGGRP